jgi:photosynthetic reaction center H subunit
MSTALTETIDVAQVVLYAFWFFFFGLIFWLRREDRREGYPLESDKRLLVGARPGGGVFMPAPKTFIHPDGHTTQAPDFKRDQREIKGERVAGTVGAPLLPTGDALLSNIGPASWAERLDVVEKTREGHDQIVPMRVATDYSVDAGPDPRGWNVVAADGKVAGVVKDLWVDRADAMVRYLELEVEGSGRRLLPITMALVKSNIGNVEVASIKSAHFASVPTIKEPDRVTVLEEEKISAFYAGGRLYADPSRVRPLV